MPIYVYKIIAPGHERDGETFEKLQGINAEPLEVDPDDGLPVKRIITSSHGRFRWGGVWTRQDYLTTDHTITEKDW